MSRSHLKVVLSLLFAVLPASLSVAVSPPNVLFIAVDDLRPELACYATRGQPIKAKTPQGEP